MAPDLSKKKVSAIKPLKSDDISISNSSNLSNSVPEFIFTEPLKSENLSPPKSPNPLKRFNSEPEFAKIDDLKSPNPSKRFNSEPEFAKIDDIKSPNPSKQSKSEPKKIDNLRETKSPNPSQRFESVSEKSENPRETKSSKTSKPQPPFSSPSASSAQLKTKSILLSDWWLTKRDGDKFGIGGFAQTSVGLQRFESASISIRHCVTLVETEDEFLIRLTGLLNFRQARLNGIPSTVCSKFMHGFPFNWEDYAKPILPNDSNEDQSLPSMDNLPMTAIRDILMSTMGTRKCDLFIKKIISEDLEKD